MMPADYQEPRWAHFLFTSTAAAWLWPVVGSYLVSVFLPAGWSKITSGKWLFGDGSPITGLVSGAIAKCGHARLARLVPAERRRAQRGPVRDSCRARRSSAVGVGLLVGWLTGIVAFGGVFLNANFVAGRRASARTRPWSSSVRC